MSPLDKMRLGIRKITSESTQIIRNPTQVDTMNVSSNLENSEILSQPVTIDLIQSTIFPSDILLST